MSAVIKKGSCFKALAHTWRQAATKEAIGGAASSMLFVFFIVIFQEVFHAPAEKSTPHTG